MKLKNSKIATSAVKKDQYPIDDLPQIALFGRSNAGKSSLINTLIERKNLARTSSTPGKTRLINFYQINAISNNEKPLEWFFVDLPGYGYAKASKSDRAHWLRFIEEYLVSDNDKICWQLVDIRHKPSEQDQMLYQILIDNGYDVTLIANKADKISKNQRAKALNLIAKTMQVNKDSIIVFSAMTKEGKSILQDRAESYISKNIN